MIENYCDECKKIITWGEYRYSITHFKRCRETDNGLCVEHQRKQRDIEYPKKLAEIINKL
jgi:hypothetical protein